MPIMRMRFSRIGGLLVISLAAVLTSCGNYDRESFRMVQGKKYELKEWPDSAFVASLDSLFRSEPLKQPETVIRPELSIDPTQAMNAVKEPANESITGVEASSSGPKQVQPAPTEMFAEKFMAALGELRADPTNGSLAQTVTVQAQEDLMSLMVRTYGPAARQMPRMMVESQLSSVNNGMDLSALKSGDCVRLPRLH